MIETMMKNGRKKLKNVFGQFEAIAFLTGFSLMAFEMVAARILAPTVGSSTYVWTSVIGVIIAALSLGYWTSGRVADMRAWRGDIAWLCLLAALTVVGTLLVYQDFLTWVVEAISDSRLQAVVAASVLFAPASFLLGMISPYLVKLKVTSLDVSGQSVAGLSALNSIGGIAGTFVTGFVLFGYIGSRETLVIIVILLLVASWLIDVRYRWQLRAAMCIALLLAALTPLSPKENVVGIDTPSAHYDILSAQYNGRNITALITGPHGAQSAVYADGSDNLVFWYTREIARLALAEKPKSILVLGGGAFTLPQYLADTLPKSTIDVVEIDPKLEQISKDYFHYRAPGNVHSIFDDARAFVRKTSKTYDFIAVDVYGDNTIPFSLMTRQFGQQLARVVKPRGLVAANVIGGRKGACRDVLAAIDSAYRPGLPFAAWSSEVKNPSQRANYILAYSKTDQRPSGMSPLLPLGGPVYTDNFSPSDRLHFACSSHS